MKWNELVDVVAARADVSKKDARTVLGALSEVALESLASGDDVTLRGVGVLSSEKRKSRTVRSIADNRKMRIGERYVVRFRAAAGARRAAESRASTHWRQPEHQAAWRFAETLIADLNLYHTARAPKDLSADANDEAVRQACAASLGSKWRNATQSYEKQISSEITQVEDYLAGAARDRWSV